MILVRNRYDTLKSWGDDAIMSVKIKIDLSSVGEILKKRGLESGGKVQRWVTTRLITVFDGYVPLDSGRLKDTATANNAAPYEEIVYDGPYARRLYYNPQYNFNGAPMRGAHWAERAWADNQDAFLSDLQSNIDNGGFL